MKLILSIPSILLVSAAPALGQGSDSCSTPTAISGNGPFAFNNTSATAGPQDTSVCGITIEHDVWFVWTAPTTATYVASTCGGTGLDTLMAVYAGTACPGGAALGCNDDSCNVQSSVSFSAAQGSSYVVQLGTYTGTPGGTGTFTITAPPPCSPSVGPDVIVGDITGPANYTASGGVEALSLGTTSCNLGTVGVGWHDSTNQHPVIGGELYRFKVVSGAGHFEQVGLSWVKHGFFAESQTLCCPNCQATDGTTLGVGCSDPYTGDRNGTQSLLGPRYQVNAHTGFFTYPPPNPSGTNTGRLQVNVSDLEVSSSGGTRYFGNSQYIAPDDATSGNGNNNCSYREVTVTGSGSAWTFGLTSSTQRQTPAIQAWPTCEPGVTVTPIQIPNEGLLMLGFKTTSLGGGQYHYEYLLYNMNSDLSVGSFSLPIANGVTVTNLGFHDVTYRGGDGVGGVNYDGTDWPPSNSGGTLVWATSTFVQNPNANAIHWGTAYNFRFDANSPPTTGTITIGTFKNAGTVQTTGDVPGGGTFPPPSISTVSPNHGANSGANGIIITGLHFTGSTSVLFGPNSASFTINNDNQITADLGATSTTGFVDVSVTNTNGTGTLTSGFDYFIPPTSIGAPCGAPSLTWQGSPTLGQTYTLITQGLGGASQWMLFDWSNSSPSRALTFPSSTGCSATPCPRFVRADTVQALGNNTTFNLAIPNSPSLVGVHVRVQALIIGCPRLSTQALDAVIGL